MSGTRPPRSAADGLGLRRAMPERMLPSVVAAMAFLACLALAAAVGARLLAQRWSAGAGAILTVQVPDPTDAAATQPGMTRIDAVMARLAHTPRLSGIHRLGDAELRSLLQPWLGGTADGTLGATRAEPGGDISLPLPAVVQLRLAPDDGAPPALAEALAPIAPGTLVENSAAWSGRLLALTTSLQACAGLALLMVGGVAGCVVALATRAGMATRRHAIEIVHGLGAADGYIAGRFARRAGWLALCGGAAGAILALPVLAGLCHLAAPFVAGRVTPDTLPGAAPTPPWTYASAVPGMLLVALPALPLAAGLIGWLTAQGTVRVWLRRLP